MCQRAVVYVKNPISATRNINIFMFLPSCLSSNKCCAWLWLPDFNSDFCPRCLAPRIIHRRAHILHGHFPVIVFFPFLESHFPRQPTVAGCFVARILRGSPPTLRPPPLAPRPYLPSFPSPPPPPRSRSRLFIHMIRASHEARRPLDFI